ncbi:MAG TPA: GNAT family N-acetyltransferase [Gaiellaceae bacterium]|nr:GNAT family N-acetyltransferase [Gaiellaceae bacterium]
MRASGASRGRWYNAAGQGRRATAHDRDALLALWDEWVAASPSPPWLPPGARAGTAEGIDRSIAVGWAFAAEREGRLVGLAAAVPRGDAAAELVELYVTPTARGVGLATELVRAVAAELRAAGVRHALVSTAPDGPARRLYERWGFAVESVRLVAAVDALDL